MARGKVEKEVSDLTKPWTDKAWDEIPMVGDRPMYYGMDGQPISRRRFVELYQDKGLRRVALTQTPNGFEVSTVLLALDHSFGSGPPIIFESMVFRIGQDGQVKSYEDLDQERYSTREQALIGHQMLVDKWSARGPSSEWRRRIDDGEPIRDEPDPEGRPSAIADDSPSVPTWTGGGGSFAGAGASGSWETSSDTSPSDSSSGSSPDGSSTGSFGTSGSELGASLGGGEPWSSDGSADSSSDSSSDSGSDSSSAGEAEATGDSGSSSGTGDA